MGVAPEEELILVEVTVEVERVVVSEAVVVGGGDGRGGMIWLVEVVVLVVAGARNIWVWACDHLHQYRKKRGSVERLGRLCTAPPCCSRRLPQPRHVAMRA